MPGIWVFDTGMNLAAMIDGFSYLSFTRKWRTPGEFELRVSRYSTGADSLVEEGYIGYYRNGRFRFGIVLGKELALTEKGKISEEWIVKGRELAYLLTYRIAMNVVDQGSGYHTIVAPDTEAAMRELVNKNCIDPSNNNRVMPGLALGTDHGYGAPIETRFRFQNVGEGLEQLGLYSGLGYSVDADLDTGNISFNVRQGTDRTATVFLSPEFANVRLLRYSSNSEDEKTFVYLGGEEEAADRVIYEYWNAAAEPTGYDRKEIFIDGRDCSGNDQLIARGEETLAQYAETVTLDVEYLESDSFEYDTDFFLGDMITVDYTGIATVATRIIGVTEEYSHGEIERVYLLLGKEPPDLGQVLKREKKNYSVGVRR
jgi:hypothetical protein